MKHVRRAALAAGLTALLLLLGGCVSQVSERELADLSAAEIKADVPAPTHCLHHPGGAVVQSDRRRFA